MIRYLRWRSLLKLGHFVIFVGLYRYICVILASKNIAEANVCNILVQKYIFQNAKA